MTKPQNFLKQFNKNLALPKKGDIVAGTVIGFGPFAVYVDLGALGTGTIFGKEYYQAKSIIQNLNIGDEISAKIVEIDNEDGYIELSLKEAHEKRGWDKLKELKENFETVTIKPSGANKGGLLAELYGIRGFLPLSQLSIQHYPRVENGNTAEILKHLQQLVGKELRVKILSAEPNEGKLIFSEKAVESKAIQELLKNYKKGDIVEGTITGLADFGAFIRFPFKKSKDVEGPDFMEGLIHISELDWQLIHHPSEVVKVGDKVKAKIVDISKDGRVSLSLKALKEDPWKKIEKKFKVGQTVKGKVIKINPFGAIVEIAPKIRGLVHVSDFGSEMKLKEILKEGNVYQFQIDAFNPKEHKLTLKLK
ncbi:S1 RNA-binding domain-containing protein [bacterium]|nr:S1 RNA-binding domain-containing protein [bacterium]